MTDHKTADFLRINEPRIKRALDQIGHVENSAVSLRMQEEGQRLLQKVVEYINPPTTGLRTGASPVAPHGREVMGGKHVEATPPIAKEMSPLADLGTQQLVDRMIACGAELARRRV